jgi:uncharacterized protein YvpB
MDFEAVTGNFHDTPGHTGDSGYDVPTSLDLLPDGQQTLVIGDVSRYAAYNHVQGDNQYGFQEDCGLCSCGDVLNQFGVNVSENDVVSHAVAKGECDVSESDQTQDGGTTLADQAKLLSDYGVPAHAEQGQSLEDLATDVEHGHGVIVGVNAGTLWNDSTYYDNGEANHAVTVTGVARDPHTGQIDGFYVNDSGDGQSAQFVPASTMTNAWVHAGGTAVVTDSVHTGGSSAGAQGAAW